MSVEQSQLGCQYVMNRPNASFSKNYLTKDNYRGPTLLRSIRGRGYDQPKTSWWPLPQQEEVNMELNEQDDRLIYAPPESSEDENNSPKNSAASSPATHRTPKRNTTKTSKPLAKRAASTAATTRPKRRKLQDEHTLDSVTVAEDPNTTDLFGSLMSSNSQKRRQHRGYAQRKFTKEDPIEEEIKTLSKEQGFVTCEEVELPEKEVPQAEFVQIADALELATPRERASKYQKTILHELVEETPLPQKSKVQIPEMPDFSSTNGTDQPEIFDALTSPEKKGHQRSESNSSLSSVDDLFLLAHDDEFKMEAELEPSGVRCPVCQKPVHSSRALVVPENLRTLAFQQQQNFCAQHRVADARELWQERDYPKISWEDLESSRIGEKLPDLELVISRQKSSFYLDQLDGTIFAAKGNRRKIRNYLNEGLIDVAKPGYYGPKGARIMVNAITEALTDTLSQALQSDSALRAAGVGGYVSAVLVPELTLQLVMDDMKLRNAKEGRKTLDESTDIGVLLHPDDDHVRRKNDNGD